MKQKNQHVHQVFNKSMVGVLTILGLSATIYFRGTKDKMQFASLTGMITRLDKTDGNVERRQKEKHRYINLDNYEHTFKVFVGNDPGDFSPAFERLDDLQVGDSVTVYFDNPERRDAYNFRLQYLDKEDEPYFVRGNKDKYGGMLLFGVGILIGLGLLSLKRLGKIT